MRIRKRQLPLPLSSLSPDSSDPPVQLRCSAPRGRDPPNPHSEKKLVITLGEDDGDGEEESREIRRVLGGAETSYGVLPQVQSTSSPQEATGQWCEREKAFPLKKRRGSFERPPEDEHHNNRETATTAAAGKKRSRGGALMEGSRCSRVNGRGWRCCQQTLVGYSLCEHHLGKGRLRSINTVRRRSFAAAADLPTTPPPPPPPVAVASKKRVKLGVVKARSMSSLLGQTDNVIVAPPYPLPLPPPDDDADEYARI